MLAYTLVELPDDAFDEYNTWAIDDEGEIRYLDEDAWMHYKTPELGDLVLCPLPDKDSNNEDWYGDFEVGLRNGWNLYRSKLLQERQERELK